MASRKNNQADESVIRITENLPTEEIVINLDDDILGGDIASDIRPEHDELEPAKQPPAGSPAPVSEPEEDALQKAVEAAQRAEELARTRQRERDDALRLASEREVELTRAHGDREEAQYGSILTAMAAEQSALDKATSDYANLAQAGEWIEAAKAQREMAVASARLDRLEDSKRTFDSKRETDKTKPPPRTQPTDFEGRIANLPEPARVWLRQHPEFVTDQSKTDALSGVHGYLVSKKNVTQFSQAYFDALDEEFGFKAAPQPEPHQPQREALPPQRRSIPVSAPPSRDVPTASGKRSSDNQMTLSPEERAIARNSFGAVNGKDLTNAQKEYLYAQNKAKYQKGLQSGDYRDARHQR